MSNTHSAHRGRSHRKRRLLYIGLPLLAIAIALWVISPGGRLRTSVHGLAELRLTGLGTRVQSLDFVTAHRSISLALSNGYVHPLKSLQSRDAGMVIATIKGPPLLSWLPWEEERVSLPVVTPEAPQVLQPVIDRNLVPGLTLMFATPVSQVLYSSGNSRGTVMALRNPTRRVTLPLRAPKAGTNGVITVSAKARSWEKASLPQKVEWKSAPFVTVRRGIAGDTPNSPFKIVFSQPLRISNQAHWTVQGEVPGRWIKMSASTYEYVPNSVTGFGPDATVSITIPGGVKGPIAVSGATLDKTAVVTWDTPSGSVLRLQQLLAEEGYLPVNWTPSTTPVARTLSYEESTIYHPPIGTFTWKYPDLPSVLRSLWEPGEMTVVTEGALMQFERVNNLPVTGTMSPGVWATLIQDRVAGKVSPDGYTYIDVTETLPETMELWVNGKLAIQSVANTGIAVTPTSLGTFPIYERLPFQIMRGLNPNGVPYADPVHWINYFSGGDAVHAFVRASYGFPQSLGCVELPPAIGQELYPLVHYGTLVTVNPPGVLPAPANPG